MPLPSNSCVAALTESPSQVAPAFTPKRLLLLVPAVPLGMLRPQLLSSAACATTPRGCTPSCCAARCACGQRLRTNCAFSAALAGVRLPVVAGAAAGAVAAGA